MSPTCIKPKCCAKTDSMLKSASASACTDCATIQLDVLRAFNLVRHAWPQAPIVTCRVHLRLRGMGFYYGDSIHRVRVQYRAVSDDAEPAGEWQQIVLAAAELGADASASSNEAAVQFTVSAVDRDPALLDAALRAALDQRTGATVELRQAEVEVHCTDTVDAPPTSYLSWLPVRSQKF